MVNAFVRKKLKSVFRRTYPLLAKIEVPYPSKSLLIVRLDAVGDYVLFRNSIQHMKNSKKYKDYRFYLLGNKRFEGLATYFDADVFKSFFWIDPEILRNPDNKQRFLLMLKLKFYAFDIIINPVHSRLIFIDAFINEIGGKHKIASKGDITNWPSANFEEFSRKCYDQLVEVPDGDCFEFYRNKKFVENLLEEKLTSFDLDLTMRSTFSLNQKKLSALHIVVVPGASANFRRWDVSNFIEVIEKLAAFLKNNVNFVITGSANEKPLGIAIQNGVSAKIHVENYAGKTELAELVRLIDNADLVISNETSTVHIAAAVKTPVVCIAPSYLYSRFHPYPPEMGKAVQTLYSEAFNHNTNAKENEVHLDTSINTITPERVLNAAKIFLSAPKNNQQMTG